MASIFDNPFGLSQHGFTPGDIKDAYKVRQNQIDDFSANLSALRAEYLKQIPQLNMSAFRQFGADAAARFAGTGETAGSGAFQEALAKHALALQTHMFDTAYNTGRSNFGAVDAARAGAYGVYGNSLASGLSAPTSNPLGGALFGSLVGSPGKIFSAISTGMNQPGAPALPPTEAEAGMMVAGA